MELGLQNYLVSLYLLSDLLSLLLILILYLAVAEELESKTPLIFGPNGAGSRVFSLAVTAFTLGIMLGPLVSGSLSEAIGYYYMNVTFCKHSSSAVIILPSANPSGSIHVSSCFCDFVLFPRPQERGSGDVIIGLIRLTRNIEISLAAQMKQLRKIDWL
jgi:hypothetical protein